MSVLGSNQLKKDVDMLSKVTTLDCRRDINL